jgi:uncharacterized membrane protein YhaH (DUF805 family)
MDFSTLKTPEWLMIGGAVGFFIFGFFDWVTIRVGGINVGSTGNVFDFFWTGVVPWILVIGAGVVTLMLAAGRLRDDQLPWPLILLAATGVAAVLLLFRLIFNPIQGTGLAGIEAGRGIGMILSVASGIVAFVGAYLNFTSKGGDIKDLTDIDKLKASFAKSDSVASDQVAGDTAPPPPPPPPPAPPVDPAPPGDPAPPPPPPPAP